MAKAIHWDNGKGKREKKECGGGSIGISNNCGQMTGPSSTTRMGVGTSLAPTAGTLRRTGTSMATMGPLTTAGAEKNATTEVRFPQWLSIRWTLPGMHTSAGWKGGAAEQCDGDG